MTWLLRLAGPTAVAAGVCCFAGAAGAETGLATEVDAPAMPAWAASAPVPTWKPIGPVGGIVGQVSWCSAAPGVVYAGTDHAGVFRSDDGGAHWTAARAGLPHSSVAALLVSPGDCSVAYAATATSTWSSVVSVTRDGGASWQDASAGLGGSAVSAFVLDPHDGSTVYAVAATGLFRTRFGQAAWSAVWLTGQSPRLALLSAAVDPRASSTLYAGLVDTDFGNLGGLYKSTDGGRTWAEANGRAHTLANQGGAHNLLFDPASPTTLYVITGALEPCGEIYKTTDGARTWTHVQIVAAPVCSLSASPAGTLFAGVVATPTVYRSQDHGATWRPAGFDSLDVYSIVAGAPADPSRLLATSATGLWISADGGLGWRPANDGLAAQRVTSVNVAADGTLYAQADNGLYRTSRQGRRWELTDFGSLLALDPQRPETLYAAFAYPYVPFPYGRSTDGGVTWSEFDYPDYDSFLVVDPVKSGRLYSVSSPYDGNDVRCFLFKSFDAGVTWSCLRDNLGFDTLLVDPRQPAVLYGTGGGYAIAVQRSDDGGTTWTRADQGLPDEYVQALAIDPSHSAVLYAATDHGLFRTTDQGRSWQLWSLALSGSTRRLIVDPHDSSRLYAGELAAAAPSEAEPNGRGVFVSIDGGVTWAPLGQRLPTDRFNGALDLDPHPPGTLYAGTDGEGTFRLDLEP